MGASREVLIRRCLVRAAEASSRSKPRCSPACLSKRHSIHDGCTTVFSSLHRHRLVVLGFTLRRACQTIGKQTDPIPRLLQALVASLYFETTQQSQWPIVRLLHAMTFQILLCHGRYPGREPLSDFDRIPLRGSIRPEPSALTYLMLAPPTRFLREAQLESGSFDFYQVVGISEAEAAYARSHDGPALLELLVAHDYFPVTDPDRSEVTNAA